MNRDMMTGVVIAYSVPLILVAVWVAVGEFRRWWTQRQAMKREVERVLSEVGS